MVGLQPQYVSFPPEGASPVAVGEVAPEVMEYFVHGAALMLRPDEDVDCEAYDAIKLYSSPELRSRKVRLAFCARMWLAGMLGTCSECCEKLCVFTALKKYVELDGKKVAITLLVWDLQLEPKHRKLNDLDGRRVGG